MLTAPARARRWAATILAVAALIAGTFWGNDDNWPFGPFRMYSIRNRLDGRIRSARLELTFADGSSLQSKIDSGTFALKRAEVEGQIDRFERDPSLLRNLAVTYERLHPDKQEVVGIRLYYEITSLENGRPAGSPTVVTMATWGTT
jgi:hypothetical protein